MRSVARSPSARGRGKSPIGSPGCFRKGAPRPPGTLPARGRRRRAIRGRSTAAAWPRCARGRLVEAEEALRAAVTLDPEGAGAHKALGVVLLQGGRRDEAARHFREALRLDATIADGEMMQRVIAETEKP